MNGELEIRELAYQLWEQAGRPEGRALEFWLRAEAAAFAAGPKTESPTQTPGAPTAEARAEIRGHMPKKKKASAKRSGRPR